MALYKTRGIIIGRHNFGEADRIIVILTPDKGVIRAVARGVRKIKSRLAGHLELFCESDLMLATGKNLDVLTSARLLWHPSQLADNYATMQQAFLFTEMVAKLGGEQEDHDGWYQVLATALRALDQGRGGPELELWFKLRLLSALGYHPRLNGCVICGANEPGRQYFFNVELGGIVDAGCSGPDNLALSSDQIKLWRLLSASGQPVRSEMADPGLAVLNAFYDYTFGKRFRSAESL